MRTGVSAPLAFVSICAKTIRFAKTRLVGGEGVHEVCYPITVARIQFPAANQQRDETMVSVGSKASNESKDGTKDILLFVLWQNYCQRRSGGRVVFNYC